MQRKTKKEELKINVKKIIIVKFQEPLLIVD